MTWVPFLSWQALSSYPLSAKTIFSTKSGETSLKAAWTTRHPYLSIVNSGILSVNWAHNSSSISLEILPGISWTTKFPLWSKAKSQTSLLQTMSPDSWRENLELGAASIASRTKLKRMRKRTNVRNKNTTFSRKNVPRSTIWFQKQERILQIGRLQHVKSIRHIQFAVQDLCYQRTVPALNVGIIHVAIFDGISLSRRLELSRWWTNRRMNRTRSSNHRTRLKQCTTGRCT